MTTDPGPLDRLAEAGVSIWLDDLSRERLRSGNLADLVATRHVVGITTNPTIFQKAMSKGDAYDDQLTDLARCGVRVEEAVRLLTAADVRAACDVLRPAYDASQGVDGRVSIEVDPRLAHDEETTVAQARMLWWLVDRPNLFIKIPGTREGLPAISTALAEGICINVTLLFGLERYRAVMDAFLTGMERAAAAGHDLTRIISVASLFVSRMDSEIDGRLDKIGTPETQALRGQAAIANARLVYQEYERVFASDRWRALADQGARPQRLLWASTGVKDPTYDDTRYVVDLVAPGTINTMPEATLDAVADHGLVTGDTVHGTYEQSRAVLEAVEALGIRYDDVVEVLEREGIEKFEVSWSEVFDSTQAALAQGAR